MYLIVILVIKFLRIPKSSCNYLHTYVDTLNVTENKLNEICLHGWLYHLVLSLNIISKKYSRWIFLIFLYVFYISFFNKYDGILYYIFALYLPAKLFKSRTNVHLAGRSIAKRYARDYKGGIVN